MKKRPNKKKALPANSMSKTYLDPYDLMIQFNISRSSIHRWCKKGLTVIKIGKKRYFPEKEVHQFMKDHRVNGKGD